MKELGELMPTAPVDLDQEVRAVAELGAELRAGKRRVFFYAASGFDWQPLHRFSHLCDIFVYVDPRYHEGDFEQARQQLVRQETKAGDGLTAVNQVLHTGAAYGTLTESFQQLAVIRDEPWTRIPDLQGRRPWGAVQRLKRHVGGTSRDLWLVFIAGSPLIAYEHLFVATGTAPVCLAACVPRFIHVEPAGELMEVIVNPPYDLPPIEQQWSDLMGWEGELGQLLRAHNAPLPNYLIADEVMAWPTHEMWYRVARWRSRWITPVFTMRNEPWPDPARALAGRRRLVVTRKPINPLSAGSVEAIVIGHETFRQYRWPDGVLVIVSGPPIFADQAVPEAPGVVNLITVGLPLRRALAEIERVCAERRISRIAVAQDLIGFEDEADDLAVWRQRDGQIKELTIHCECDGHMLDYGRVADEID